MGKGEAWKVQKWKEGNIAKYNRVRPEERCGEIRSRTRSRVELTGWRKWHLGEGFLCKPGPHALCFHPTCEVKWTVQPVLHNTNQSTSAEWFSSVGLNRCTGGSGVALKSMCYLIGFIALWTLNILYMIIVNTEHECYQCYMMIINGNTALRFPVTSPAPTHTQT